VDSTPRGPARPAPPAGARDAAQTGLLDPRDPDAAVRERLRAWLAVQALFAWHPEALAPWFAAAAGSDDPEPLLALAGRRPPPRAVLERAREALARAGARLLPYPAPLYPPRLRRLSDAPPVLALRGEPGALVVRAVAVVGARAPTAYGRGVARRIAAGLAGAGVVVVSGLARGIDAEAHRAALEVGLTVAVQGCGPDRVYPADHRRLADEIAARGCVVSELPVGAAPLAHHFPLRNRLISALAEAVVVVEARARSGSLVTARHAANQGVDVLAVPGPIDAPTSAGTHRLLRDGAGLVAAPEDVLHVLGLEAAAPAPERARPGAADSLEAEILAALAEGPLDRDSLARRLRRSPEALALPLFELELAARVEEDRDGRLRARSPLRGARL
jgi:DNA processing protein